MEVLWKGADSSQFRANRPKLCGNFVFLQNFHTGELGEISVFYTVKLEALISQNVIFKKNKLFGALFKFGETFRLWPIKDIDV